jgi:membrane protease YdiL (CAAX protease family)
LATFVLVACAVSWVLWGLALLTESWLLLFLGGVGPAAGGALVAWQQGTLRQWWARVVRWRVAPGWYALVLLVPVLIWGSANLWLALLGREPSLPEVGALVPAYVGTWIGTLFLGGLEEPGWRGFAQPHLQQRLSPVRATLLVGVIWGLWHLPIEPLAILVTVPLAFLYAWLLNRTGSVLLCILLHASITPAQEHLIPTPVTLATHAVVGATLVAVALAITVVTRGRLGLPAPTPATAVGQLAPGQNQAAGL